MKQNERTIWVNAVVKAWYECLDDLQRPIKAEDWNDTEFFFYHWAQALLRE